MGRGSDFSHLPTIDVSGLVVGGPWFSRLPTIDVSGLVVGGPWTRRIMPEARTADTADQESAVPAVPRSTPRCSTRGRSVGEPGPSFERVRAVGDRAAGP